MAAAQSANYHQTHVSRQLKHNYNNDGLEDDADREDDGGAASKLRSSEESVERGAGEGLQEALLSHILEPCVARKVHRATFKVYIFTK